MAADIATNGLQLEFSDTFLSWRDNPPRWVITSKKKFPVLTPFAEDWVERGILMKDHIPADVFFSRWF